MFNKVYLGDKNINKIYLGNTLIKYNKPSIVLPKYNNIYIVLDNKYDQFIFPDCYKLEIKNEVNQQLTSNDALSVYCDSGTFDNSMDIRFSRSVGVLNGGILSLNKTMSFGIGVAQILLNSQMTFNSISFEISDTKKFDIYIAFDTLNREERNNIIINNPSKNEPFKLYKVGSHISGRQKYSINFAK